MKSMRKSNWDYGQTGNYFITIVVKNREMIFGKVQNGQMNLSKEGIVANEIWKKTPEICSNVQLGEFIIMPDHMHAIVKFTRINPRGEKTQIYGKVSQCLSSLVRGYKSAVTSNIRKFNPHFHWQSRFHRALGLRIQWRYKCEIRDRL